MVPPSDGRPDDDSLRSFSNLLATLRERSNLSLREVAEEVGSVTASYLGILEKENPKTGKPSRPSRELVLRLARALKASRTDTKNLATYAGYDISSVADQQAVAYVLESGRLPAVISDLLQLETDLFGYTKEMQMVEAPSFTVLGHFDRDDTANDQVYVTGVAFKARGIPARLYALKDRLKSDAEFKRRIDLIENREETLEPLKIVVLGQFMTPTVLLLNWLNLAGCSYKVRNEDRSDASFSYVDGDGPVFEIEVVYSDEAQVALLKVEYADLALMIYPFRRVQDNQTIFDQRPKIDLWSEYRDGELPMSLVVTTGDLLRADASRQALIDRMDRLRLMYQQIFGDRVKTARRALRDHERFAAQHRNFEEAALEPFPDVYLSFSEREELAGAMSTLASMGCDLNVLLHKRDASYYLPFILSKEELLSKDVSRFASADDRLRTEER